jgi:hypothetical protein
MASILYGQKVSNKTNIKNISNFKILSEIINKVAKEGGRVVVFNATFNSISVIWWRSVLFCGETHRPAASL